MGKCTSCLYFVTDDNVLPVSASRRSPRFGHTRDVDNHPQELEDCL
jgi:hypothetical protein